MTKERLIELIDEGHELEFRYKGKAYSITYGEIEGKECISFCEFYKETTEVETAEELCSVVRDGVRVVDMIESIPEDDIDVY